MDPVLKEESKVDYHNYHSISLLSNVGKMLKKPMYKNVYKFRIKDKFIYDLQFGFRQNISIVHALTLIRLSFFDSSFFPGGGKFDPLSYLKKN